MNHFKLHSPFAFAIVLLLILSACAQTPSEPTTLPATVETPTKTSTVTTTTEETYPPPQDFEAFYEDFKAAVRNRDMQFIDSILDAEIESSFGGDPGKEYFHEYWDGEKMYSGRDLWAVLEEIIALGGVHYGPGEYFPDIGECFVAPYTFIEARDSEDWNGGYRLCIEKKDSGWKLLWLIAGD